MFPILKSFINSTLLSYKKYYRNNINIKFFPAFLNFLKQKFFVFEKKFSWFLKSLTVKEKVEKVNSYCLVQAMVDRKLRSVKKILLFNQHNMLFVLTCYR